jgi:hypothetical protein
LSPGDKVSLGNIGRPNSLKKSICKIPKLGWVTKGFTGDYCKEKVLSE